MRPERLRIESRHGSPINDYRIGDGRVEMRQLDPSGHPYPSLLSEWKTLDASDIELHFVLETVVAKWLEARMNEEESRVVTLRTNHTGERIPESGMYRVYHQTHRLPDEVALLEGFPFPRCSKCSEKVTFRLARAAEGSAQQPRVVLHELLELCEADDLEIRRAA